MCIVKPDGPPQLCKTDEIGEIVINSRAGGTMYYGLPGVTKNTFEVCHSLKAVSHNCLYVPSSLHKASWFRKWMDGKLIQMIH